MRAIDPQSALRQLGRRVAELRASKGITQEALAYAAGYSSARWIQRLESGLENITVRTAVRLANLLHVELHDLFERPTGRAMRVRPRAKSPGKRASSKQER